MPTSAPSPVPSHSPKAGVHTTKKLHTTPKGLSVLTAQGENEKPATSGSLVPEPQVVQVSLEFTV